MSKPTRGATSSVDYSGNKTFPQNNRRNYFFVVMSGGVAGTIEFGGGGGQIPIAADSYYEPYVAPISEIIIRCSGDYVVHTDPASHAEVQ